MPLRNWVAVSSGYDIEHLFSRYRDTATGRHAYYYVQVNVYDVAGRKLRTLADRLFPAGEQTLVWDGADDTGRKVSRGVYFVRSSTQPSAGRIIVLNN